MKGEMTVRFRFAGEIHKKPVCESGNKKSGIVYVDHNWVGKKVGVILLN